MIQFKTVKSGKDFTELANLPEPCDSEAVCRNFGRFVLSYLGG